MRLRDRCIARWSIISHTPIPARRTPSRSSGSRGCAANGRPNACGAISAGSVRTSTTCVWASTRATSSRPADRGARCSADCAALDKIKPDVVTVAFDPEASGPDTHYKVLQAVNEACRAMRRPEKRRNPHLGLSQRLVPVPSGRGQHLCARVAEHVFRHAERLHEHLRLATRSLVPQLRVRRAVLANWPSKSRCSSIRSQNVPRPRVVHRASQPLIRATRGFVFLREMNLEEFRTSARDLRQAAEAV